MKRQNKSNKNWSHKHDYPEEEIWQTGHLIAQLIGEIGASPPTWRR